MMTTGLDVAKLLQGLDLKEHMELVQEKLGDKIGTLFATGQADASGLIYVYSQQY